MCLSTPPGLWPASDNYIQRIFPLKTLVFVHVVYIPYHSLHYSPYDSTDGLASYQNCAALLHKLGIHMQMIGQNCSLRMNPFLVNNIKMSGYVTAKKGRFCLLQRELNNELIITDEEWNYVYSNKIVSKYCWYFSSGITRPIYLSTRRNTHRPSSFEMKIIWMPVLCNDMKLISVLTSHFFSESTVFPGVTDYRQQHEMISRKWTKWAKT